MSSRLFFRAVMAFVVAFAAGALISGHAVANGVATYITKADDGKTVEVKNGTLISVELPRTTGSKEAWRRVATPDFLLPEKIIPAQDPDPAVILLGQFGASHRFQVIGTGEGVLAFAKVARPGGKSLDTLSVRIVSE